jgi:pimeloyl-ACP methyl ester carboxylesterase
MQDPDVSFDSGGMHCAATVYRPGGATGVVGCVVMGNGITLTRKDGIPYYAQRFADAGFAVVAFDYRHWGDSGGEPRRTVSLRRQLEDWRAAVQYARGLEGVNPERVALWGMSLGGGLALMTAAADPRLAATVALVPMADGLAAVAQPAPPGVTARLTWSIIRRALTRRPVTIPVAGAPGSFAVIAAPEALPGFKRLASGNGWRNEVNAAGLLIPSPGFAPSGARLASGDRCWSSSASEMEWSRFQRSKELALVRRRASSCATRSTTSDASGLNTSDISAATSSSSFTDT